MSVQYLVVTRTSQILIKTSINPRAMCATICNNPGELTKAHKLQEGDLICFYQNPQGDLVRKTAPTFNFMQDTYASLCLVTCFHTVSTSTQCLDSVCLKVLESHFEFLMKNFFQILNLVLVLFVLPPSNILHYSVKIAQIWEEIYSIRSFILQVVRGEHSGSKRPRVTN